MEMIANGITQVLWLNDVEAEGSIASVGVETGTLYLNKDRFPQLTPEAQYFIICHEWGHIKGKTASELEADRIGFAYYVKSGMSLKKAVDALLLTPTFISAEIKARQHALLKRALDYDYEVNGNKNAKIY